MASTLVLVYQCILIRCYLSVHCCNNIIRIVFFLTFVYACTCVVNRQQMIMTICVQIVNENSEMIMYENPGWSSWAEAVLLCIWKWLPFYLKSYTWAHERDILLWSEIPASSVDMKLRAIKAYLKSPQLFEINFFFLLYNNLGLDIVNICIAYLHALSKETHIY